MGCCQKRGAIKPLYLEHSTPRGNALEDVVQCNVPYWLASNRVISDRKPETAGAS